MKPASNWHRLATVAVAIAAAAPSGCLPPQFFPLIVLADAVEGHRDPNLDTGPDTTNFQNAPAVSVVSNAPFVSVDPPQDRRKVGPAGVTPAVLAADSTIEHAILIALWRMVEARRGTRDWDVVHIAYDQGSTVWTMPKNKVYISVTAVNGVLLLTGEVPTKEWYDELYGIARNTDNVRQVVYEIRVAEPLESYTRRNDTRITREIEARLFTDSDIKVHTANSVVYLMGLVSPADAQAATDVATRVAGVTLVKRVFEYVD